jgi:outer membrane protein assembly factor BamE (lipoprotein component of BamABCDE complex)
MRLAYLAPLALALAACSPTAKPTDTTAPATPPPSTVAPAPAHVEVTLEEYNRLTPGMTKDQVAEIVGGPGESMSTSDIAGYHTETLKYDGAQMGANAILTFQNEKLQTKAQFGLR